MYLVEKMVLYIAEIETLRTVTILIVRLIIYTKVKLIYFLAKAIFK